MIAKELLDILACPLCKTAVEMRGEYIVCPACRRHYPVRDGIPTMLVEEAFVPPAAPPRTQS
ncbi:MAG: Trm112 family protein [Candidatus Omnitrophica bacterium]|nr:Trm112 family protein [Candidatus Omnitrophota bacterium]